jgi:hypothetical protein
MRPVEPNEINFIAALLVVTATTVGLVPSIIKRLFTRTSRWPAFWPRFTHFFPRIIGVIASLTYLTLSWSAMANENVSYRIVSLGEVFEMYVFLVVLSLAFAGIMAAKPYWEGPKLKARSRHN